MTTPSRPSLAALSALAGCICCGDHGSDHCSLSLPEEPVELTAEHRQHVRRFRVESHDGRFDLRLTFKTEGDPVPSLDLRPVDPSALERIEGSPAGIQTEWYGRATVSCTAAFPCAAEFEAVVTAINPDSARVEGRLSIEVRLSECGTNPDRLYLAIEPRSPAP